MSAEAHAESESSRGGRVSSARVFAAAFLGALALLGPLRESVFPTPYARLSKAEAETARDGWSSSQSPGSNGGVFTLDPSVRDAMWGTLIRGDGTFEGEVVVFGPAPNGPKVIVPVTGRTSAPNSLKLRALDTHGKLLCEIAHPGRDFGIVVDRWEVEVPRDTARIELVMVDATTGPGAWLGVGRPGTSSDRTVAPLTKPIVNQGFYLAHVIAIAGFVFLPGLALRRWKRFEAMPAAMLPLPGMALMALGGIVLWLAGSIPGFTVGYGILHAFAGVIVLTRRGPDLSSDEDHAAVLYGLLVLIVLAWSLVPLPVEREFFEGTNARGRMVASPPDSAIPYQTAAYFLRAHEGVAKEHFIGGEWSVTSRGPVAAWMITTAFKEFGITPGDPPIIATQVWPADREGYFVARIIGIFSNALVVLAAPAAIAALAGGRRRGVRFGAGWIALSPVVFINSAFLWPKMLATFFGMLAIAEIGGRRRAWVVGAWLALSYFSHPVGVLIAAPVCLWLGALGWSEGAAFRARVTGFLRAAFSAGLWMLAFAAPWLAYKAIEGKPDVFLRYPLGDGHGYAIAPTFQEWLTCRLDNLVYSLVPGTLWHSQMLVQWAGGDLSSVGHIAMNYQKVLLLGIGLAMSPVFIWRFLRPADAIVRSFRFWMLVVAFALMLLVWGFSRDGLGRNCLEPLFVFAILATVAAMPRVTAIHRVLLGLVSLELIALLVFAFTGDPSFTGADIWPGLWWLFATGGAVWVALTWLALSPPRESTGDEAR